MPNILLVDLKTIARSKEQTPIIEVDYEILDDNLNQIGNENRILINPQIKSRTYQDGTTTHPKGEGVNKNYPNFKERYEEICSLLQGKQTIVMFYSEEGLYVLSQSSRRYKVEAKRFRFSCLTSILSEYDREAYRNSLVKTYRKMTNKNRKEVLPSNIKMMEELLKGIKHKYGFNLSRIPTSITSTLDNYPGFISVGLDDVLYGIHSHGSKSDA